MTAKVEGAQQLTELAAKLKKLERGDLRRELLRTLRAEAKPLGEAARKSALEILPKSGGLNQVVAAPPVRVRTRLSARSAQVRLVDPSKHDFRKIDEGQVRHKVFGVWRKGVPTQQVTPGWWTKPMEENSPRVRAAIVRTIEEISRKLT